MWQHFEKLKLPLVSTEKARRRYSVTADIIAFQQCSLQYGAFAARKYEPALAVQLFYGTVIHQVLDRAHRHYKGELSAPAMTFPTDDDIEGYFVEVESSLKARGIRAVNNVRQQALRVLQRFNSIEGPVLYPRIFDTECRLQADKDTYILHGNVDVLLVTEGEDDEDRTGVEIWDYKGAYLPSLSSPDYQRYVFQMQVYADLYKQKTGVVPEKAVLYFLNELAFDPPPTDRPVNAVLEVNLEASEVHRALDSFGRTVVEIESCRTSHSWRDPDEPPSEATCDACDLRWNCDAAASFGRTYPLIYP